MIASTTGRLNVQYSVLLSLSLSDFWSMVDVPNYIGCTSRSAERAASRLQKLGFTKKESALIVRRYLMRNMEKRRG